MSAAENPQKVYLVRYGENPYVPADVERVFATRALAKAYVQQRVDAWASSARYYDIEEWDVVEALPITVNVNDR